MVKQRQDDPYSQPTAVTEKTYIMTSLVKLIPSLVKIQYKKSKSLENILTNE